MSHPPVSPEFLAVFRTHADARGAMSFARFMELALYHPDVGYYRRAQARVGYGPGTDFFTASTSGTVFGELVCAACVTLLGGRDPRAHAFVEIGAEPGGGVLAGVAHPFRETRTIGIGQEPAVDGECIVFSNELFDAQPCVRTVVRDGRWHEVWVRLDGDHLVEFEHPFNPPPSDAAPAEAYRLDRPLAAAQLATRIAGQPWRGLFVAFDYGKTWQELVEQTPAGTVRAYHRHTQTNDVLARPGEQDLTCHICWDWIADALRQQGFAEPALEFQETFLMRHAGRAIEAMIQSEAAHLSPRKRSLMQLLHPAHLGQKFQVMHALR